MLLLFCSGTYRAYIIMRMSSLAFQYRNYINEFSFYMPTAVPVAARIQHCIVICCWYPFS